MDEAVLRPEAGLEGRAISYTKGCYSDQEVIARKQAARASACCETAEVPVAIGQHEPR